jgi:hypothetical protein
MQDKSKVFEHKDKHEWDEKYNNSYSHSKTNTLKLLRKFLDKFESLSPHNDLHEEQEKQNEVNKIKY